MSPWHIESDNPGCSGYAVVKDDDGSIAGCHDMKQEAEDQLAALYANEDSLAEQQSQAMADRLQEVREFVRDVDHDLQRVFPFVVEDVRDSGSGKGIYTVRGHAAVFDKWSLDLGGFRERIMPGAFDDVLSDDPHVLHLWDHDTRYTLSSTRNKTLELRVDPVGLHYWSKVAPTSYAADLRVLLERGDIDQSSFAFTVSKDEWRIKEEKGEEIVERDVIGVKQLFDVTTCAMGAYPTTDAAVAVRKLVSGRSQERAAATAGHPLTTGVATPTTFTFSGNLLGSEEVASTLREAFTESKGTPEASDEDAKASAKAEERKREFERWRSERMAEYRRTREFAFGVDEKES